MMTRKFILSVESISVGYDRIDVLKDVSIRVADGSITCILGSNGAGKTTLIRSILGLTPPRSGKIIYRGKNLCDIKTHHLTRNGISCIPEGRKIFSKMTVEENLLIGAYHEKSRLKVKTYLSRVYGLFPRLKERKDQVGGTMSGGEQAMISIGRSLMSSPEFLIVDEPSLGLSPLFVKESFDIIRKINGYGTSILLVEQNVHQTLAVAHYGYVLNSGRVVAEGEAVSLQRNPHVREAYFS